MKNILSTIAIIIMWCSLSSSGCGDGGNSSVTSVPAGTSGGTTGGTNGIGGSTARFTISKNHLYAIHNDSLKVFAIKNARFDIINQLRIGNNIETIYPFGDKLFIAGNTGMTAYNIASPANPLLEGSVSHVTGCDPVVANSTHVYLTIHGGTTCRNNINELQIFQLKNPFNTSVFLKKVDMNRPLGLGLKNNNLYVCDRGIGIKVFDVTTPASPTQLHIINCPNAKDVIPFNDILVCNTETGLSYYDISNPNQSTFLTSLK